MKKFKYTKLEVHNLKFSRYAYINLHGHVAGFGLNGYLSFFYFISEDNISRY